MRGTVDGDFKVKSFSCLDQYLCMAFAQLTYRESLRGIETCLRFQLKLYHLDLHGSIPTFIFISDGKFHEVKILDMIPREPDAFYLMDRGYLDFARLYTLSRTAAFFLIRAKSNLKCRRVYSHPVDRSTGLICDQSVMLTGFCQAKDYPEKIRRVKYYDTETDQLFVFLTNNFALPASTIAHLYRCRWQVEIFFKWIKQNLRIKRFYGTSENAAKT